jgi:hypothetical protein
MAYSSELADLVAAQLRRFATLNRHQLAGHVANLDFWLAEARHCLDVIDGYWTRFQRMKAAQAAHVARHGTVEFRPDDPCCTTTGAIPPKPLPDAELVEPRRAVCEAAYRFLVRCFHENLIDEATLRRGCEGLEISVETTDVKRRS